MIMRANGRDNDKKYKRTLMPPAIANLFLKKVVPANSNYSFFFKKKPDIND